MAKEIFQREENVKPVKTPVIVVGDGAICWNKSLLTLGASQLLKLTLRPFRFLKMGIHSSLTRALFL